jgi:hypothetical protein
MTGDNNKPFWDNLLKAVEAEPQEKTAIRGASGIVHSAVAIGLDSPRRRLLVISAEHDARTAALAQIDIQAALNDTQVLVARPLAVDFSIVAKNLLRLLGRDQITSEDIAKLQPKAEGFQDVAKPLLGQSLAALEFIEKVPLPAAAQWMQAVQQLASMDFTHVPGPDATKGNLIINFRKLADLDPVEYDNAFGICPVPLYLFTPSDADLLNGNPNLDDVRDLLRRHGLIRYFFPAADELALGLVDRGADSPQSVLDQLLLTPTLGHPYGPTALVSENTKLTDMIDALGERGMIVEGEVGLEVGPGGKQIRTSLKFKPQEGLLSKIINRFSLNLDLKDFLNRH